MKTKLPVLVAMVLFAQAAMAQLNFGVKVGANINKIQGQSFKNEFSYGYHAGGFAIIGLGGKLAIQPEVLFNQYNTKVDSNFRNVYQTAFSSASNGDVKLNYLSIPILLNYKLGNSLTLQAGPQFGTLINKNDNLVQNGKNAFKNGDFSMVGGLQLKVLKFLISGRYLVGLNNINDLGNQNQWKTQGIQVSVGLAL